MAFAANEVRTAPSGHVYVGALGALEPADVSTDLTEHVELGYLTPDGVSITPSVDQEDINVWQSLMPVLTPITGMTLEISFTLSQVNRDTLGLYFLGEEVTDDGSIARLDINSNPGSQERSLVIEWEDNVQARYRLVVPRAQMTNREELQLTRSSAKTLGLTFSALDSDGLAGYILSDAAHLLSDS